MKHWKKYAGVLAAALMVWLTAMTVLAAGVPVSGYAGGRSMDRYHGRGTLGPGFRCRPV